MEEEVRQQPEVTEEELSRARDLFKTFQKTTKTLTVYPKQNPISQKFITELDEKFTGFLNTYGDVRTRVEQFSLVYRDKEVFHSEDRQDNLALSLFLDGIREFTFHAGLSLNEIETFLDILKAAPKEENPEDDIVTLLWEKELEHISYFVPEDVSDEDISLENEFLSKCDSGGSGGEQVAGASYSDVTIIPAGIEVELSPFSDDELKDLKTELGGLESAKLLSLTADMFLQLINEDATESDYAIYMRGIGQIANLWIDLENTGAWFELVKKVLGINSSAEPVQAQIKQFMEKASSNETVNWFMSNSKDKDRIEEFLTLIAPYGINTLINVLGENEDRRIRKIICNALAVLASKDLSHFLPYLKDERWYLVRNIVLIFGLSKNSAAVKHIKEAARHPEARVRRECIKSLENIGSDEGKPLLFSYLEDPDVTARTYALKALRRYPGRDVLDRIRKDILEEDFRKRPFIEKKEYLESFGFLAKGDAFPILENFFRKKKALFKKDENLELRAAAAYGLAYVPGERATRLLRDEASSNNKSLLKEACTASLRLAAQRPK